MSIWYKVVVKAFIHSECRYAIGQEIKKDNFEDAFLLANNLANEDNIVEIEDMDGYTIDEWKRGTKPWVHSER